MKKSKDKRRRGSRDKERYGSGTRTEIYAALSALCEGSEMNGARPFRSSYCAE